MNIWIIVYCIIAYMFIGLTVSAIMKAAGYKDDDGDGWKVTTTLFWPVVILTFLIAGICVACNAFIDYIASQISNREGPKEKVDTVHPKVQKGFVQRYATCKSDKCLRMDLGDCVCNSCPMNPYNMGDHLTLSDIDDIQREIAGLKATLKQED